MKFSNYLAESHHYGSLLNRKAHSILAGRNHGAVFNSLESNLNIAHNALSINRYYCTKTKSFNGTPINDYQTKESVLHKIHADNSVLLKLYQRPDIIFTHGEKCNLYDTFGNRYLDLTAGIAVNALGHSHPALLNAIRKQSEKLIHISNLYHNEHAGDFAKQLIQPLLKTRPPVDSLRVFLCNSGTEANEAAIKFARKWGNTFGPSKHTIVSFNNAFHGRSMGALSATPSPKYQSPFLPMLPGFVYSQFNDVTALEKVVSDEVCGVILEPIQGEGGIHVASNEFMEAIRDKCNKHNALMIVDEIQAGIGRTGKMFAHQWYSSVHPDIITVAKPLANGIPSGAVILADRVAEILKPGDHGTTFGGSPFSCAVGKAVLSEIERTDFLDHVSVVGDFFKNQLKKLASRSPIITDVRGQGLILGIQLHENVDPKLFVDLCRDRFLLVVSAGCNTIRFVPPLIITKEEVQDALKVMEEVIDVMQNLIARGKDK